MATTCRHILSQRYNSLKPLFHHHLSQKLKTSYKISSRQTTLYRLCMMSQFMGVLNFTECPNKNPEYFLEMWHTKTNCQVLAMILFYSMPKYNNIFSQNVNNIFKLKFHAFVGISFFVLCRIIMVAHHLYSQYPLWQCVFLMTGN